MRKKIEIVASRIFELLIEKADKYRNIVLQGGSRSSKTFSLAQYIIYKCLEKNGWRNKIITICRKSFPTLRSSVMRDFFEILNQLRLYSPENHNKTTHEYKLNSNLIEFVSIDQEQKVRGRKRHIAWLNEANEFEYEDYFQLNIRTTEQVYFDYNPSDEYHWIYEKIIPRDDTLFDKSNYKDNPMLDERLRQEIERLKDEDENLWRIYGLGEVGQARDLVFTNWDVVNDFPHICQHYRYGLDFGYNHPTVLLFVGIIERELWVKQLIYQTHLTNQDLIDLMKELKVSQKVLIRADSEDAARIAEIQKAGFKCEGAKKDKASIKDSIDNIKRCKIHIIKGSDDVIKEIKNYRFKRDKKTDDILDDEPIKYKDDAMDALRYAVGDIIRDSHLFEKITQDIFDRGRKDLPRRAISNFV